MSCLHHYSSQHLY